MQVITKLNVNIDEFFDFLEKSIKFDIKNATNADLSEITPGFSYKKELKNAFNQSGEVESIIENYIRNDCYISKIISNQGVNSILYKVVKIDDENIELEYTEEFISNKKLNDANFKLVSKIFEKSLKKRINLRIKNIELSIKAQKENELCQD